MRHPGYYWCKYDGEWTVAYWSSCWELPGLYTSKEDEDFSEIDERRIERTEVSGDEDGKLRPKSAFEKRYKKIDKKG